MTTYDVATTICMSVVCGVMLYLLGILAFLGVKRIRHAERHETQYRDR
jgi:xanthine/uracil permease